MTKSNLADRDRESLKKLAYAVNAAAFGETGCALAAISEARRLSALETESGEDEVFSSLSTAVHCYLAACIQEKSRAESRARDNLVYVIQNSQSKSVKIGYTKDLKTRFAQLQTGCSHKLSVLKTLEGDTCMEKKIHLDLKDYRLSGEWFEWNNFVASYVENL
jgi:Meiotically up-regulated gene 113